MATENIRKRAKAEQESLEEGIKTSLEELEGGKVAITYNEKTFEFPKAQPAWVSMFIAVHGQGDNKDLSDANSLEFLVKLIGNDLALEIIEAADNDFSIADVAEQIVAPIQGYWSNVENAKKK